MGKLCDWKFASEFHSLRCCLHFPSGLTILNGDLSSHLSPCLASVFKNFGPFCTQWPLFRALSIPIYLFLKRNWSHSFWSSHNKCSFLLWGLHMPLALGDISDETLLYLDHSFQGRCRIWVGLAAGWPRFKSQPNQWWVVWLSGIFLFFPSPLSSVKWGH